MANFYLQDQQCCRKCKANDKANHKTCVCVVPKSQRKLTLSKDGCKTCGCFGCTKEDKEFRIKNDSNSREKNNNHDRSLESNSPPTILRGKREEIEELNNFDDSRIFISSQRSN